MVNSCTLTLGARQRGALRRQIAHVGGGDAVAVGQAQHLDATIGRQVGDEALVQHVAAKGVRLARQHRLKDVRGVLVAALMLDGLVGQQIGAHRSPIADLLDAARVTRRAE
jgi:hypothetical protein